MLMCLLVNKKVPMGIVLMDLNGLDDFEKKHGRETHLILSLRHTQCCEANTIQAGTSTGPIAARFAKKNSRLVPVNKMMRVSRKSADSRCDQK